MMHGSSSLRLRLYTDGSSIGNPGMAGIAYLLKDEGGNILAAGCEPIGIATNNQAEYHAFLRGLELARQLGAKEVEWFSDSELLVRQWQGIYRTKDTRLCQLIQQARQQAQALQVHPHAVLRNSLPEMAQVDRWARGVALDELEPLIPSPPSATNSDPGDPVPNGSTERSSKRQK